MPNGDAALAYGERLAELRRKIEEYVAWLRAGLGSKPKSPVAVAYLDAADEAERRLLGMEPK